MAISFCDEEERAYLRDIEKLINKKIPVDRDQPFHIDYQGPVRPAPPEQRGGGGGGRRGGGGGRRHAGGGGGQGRRPSGGGGRNSDRASAGGGKRQGPKPRGPISR